MDTNVLIGKLFELQMLTSRKTDLAIQVADTYTRERAAQMSLDFKRGLHRAGGPRFNEEGVIEHMSEERARNAEIRAEHRVVCAQVEALQAEIEEQVAALADI